MKHDHRQETTLLTTLAEQARQNGQQIFVVGGAVRDHLQGISPTDIDFAVPVMPLELAEQVAAGLGATVIVLDEEHGVVRLAWQGATIDLVRFKGGVATLAEDLAQRDFTINAMAFSLADWLAGGDPARLIDPVGGHNDLRAGRLRLVTAQALQDDPLRILRGYRLRAQTGFTLGPGFAAACQESLPGLAGVAAERILAELTTIFATARAGQTMAEMKEARLFPLLFAELAQGQNVSQPGSHHLDVLDHNIEALICLERIMTDLSHFFGHQGPRVADYISEPRLRPCLKWAALCHDVGKTATRSERHGRITFYQHDQKGAALFKQMAARLKMARDDSELISLFIRQHMRPFHLCNVKRQNGDISTKACLRLAKALDRHIPGLFLLSMADSLAGDGKDKPADMEKEIADLFERICQVMDEHITPVLTAPPLLNGHDLIQAGLAPGPLFRQIFDELQQLQVTEKITSRDDALDWLHNKMKL